MVYIDPVFRAVSLLMMIQNGLETWGMYSHSLSGYDSSPLTNKMTISDYCPFKLCACVPCIFLFLHWYGVLRVYDSRCMPVM